MVKKIEINNANYWRFLSDPNDYKKYWDEKYVGQELKIETTERQFNTAAEILNRLKNQKGVLLADDVGLGKTAVAVLVACVYAGKGNKVAILAPNKPMQKKWEMEIRKHVEILSSVANNLYVKLDENRQLPDNIRVITHYNAELALNSDLLIIDEAHRAKGENSKFAEKISAISKKRKKIIILTATPFSINIEELNRMLEIIGAPEDVKNHVENFCNQLEELWCSENLSPVADFSAKLTLVAKDTICCLKDYVIRHGIKDLKKDEQKHFGNEELMQIDVEMPEQIDYEILVRINRLLHLSKQYEELYDGNHTNDARHHVGWEHLKEDVESIDMKLRRKRDKKYSIIKWHIEEINKLLAKIDNHKKAEGVADKVKEIVEGEGEKVLIFCRHHATAREITRTIYSTLRGKQQRLPNKKIWEKAWEEIIKDGKPDNAPQNYDECISDYISWLCSPNIRSQTADWAGNLTNADELKDALKNKYVRKLNHGKKSAKVIISDEAIQLFLKLIDNKSISKMIYFNSSLKKMPVFSTAEYSNDDDLNFLFFPNQIDTVMAIFNSPFGPDVLVTTDKLSEGIDLHGCCRNLIHYELDPSPIRIMQRNGRIRRVNSWAARIEKPINIAYPVFKGTRDEKLVNIMKGRIKKFDLLLGGVGGKIEIDDNNDLEKYRLDIVEKAKTNMKGLSLALDP